MIAFKFNSNGALRAPSDKPPAVERGVMRRRAQIRRQGVVTRAFVRRHFFLLVGITTLGLFVLGEILPDGWLATLAGRAFLAVVRVLVSPLWLMRTLEMMLGMGAWPALLQLAVALPLLFAPYLLLDWIVARARPFRFHPTAA